MILLTAFGENGVALFMQGVFFILLLIFTIYTSFMAYHWFRYGVSRETSSRALTLYLSVGVLCFLIMGISLLYVL